MKHKNSNYVDLGIGIFVFFLTIYIYIITSSYPEPNINPVAASTFPRLLSTLMCIVSLVLIYRALKGKDSVQIVIRNYKKVLSIIGLLIIYTLALMYIGFTLSTMVLMFIILYLFEMRKYRYSILIPIIAAFVIQYIFQKFLNVPLPTGIFTII
ncbi:MAG: Tripartite tricarboxylate transporter TctB family [Clostridiales bacterium]|jgi:putative tricarboxylic transport membrane protein|nr:Tripartite tricarboxylate transporter TctB family [Clostridiales bacterium]